MTEIEIVTPNPAYVANSAIPARWTFKEGCYKIPSFILSDPSRTHELLIIETNPADQSPGHFPLAWAREYRQEKFFYTALGGDLWDPGLKNRKNPSETARVFQAHILGGIEWALGSNSCANGKSKSFAPSHDNN